MTAEPESIAYRLPVTLVRIHGTRATTRSSLQPVQAAPRVQRDATIDLDVVADHHTQFELASPSASGWQDRQLALDILPDGRLQTAGAEVTDRSSKRLEAIVTLGATVAGGALALGATPVVGVVAGLGAATAGALHLLGSGAIEELDRRGLTTMEVEKLVDDLGQEAAAPTAEDLGIHAAFKADNRADHDLLYAYRLALLQLTAEHAAMAANPGTPATKAAQLRDLNSVLASTRKEATLVEARYDTWLRSKETTDVLTVDIELYPWQVPDKKTFLAELGERSAQHTEIWWPAANQLRTMVTIDYLDGEPPGSDAGAVEPRAVPAGSVVYRRPRPAVLMTWKVVDAKPEHTGLRAELVRQERILVTAPGSERTIAVSTDRKAGKVAVGIDPSGALTSLKTTTTSAAADRAVSLGALPGALQGGLTSGATIGKAFAPAELELARLEREVKIAEANAKLKGPTDPDPTLKKLQDELATARLQASLSTARYISANPSAATIIVRSTD